MRKNRLFLILIASIFLIVLVYGVLQAFINSGKRNNPKITTDETITEPHFLRSPASIIAAEYFNNELTIEGIGMLAAIIRLKYKDKVLATAKTGNKGGWIIKLKDFDIDQHGQISEMPFRLNIDMVTKDGEIIRSSQSLVLGQYDYNIKEAETKTTTKPAFILLVEAGSSSRLLQSPFDFLPEKQGFSIETIDYDNSGGVIFTGSSKLRGKVAIYVDGVFVTESLVDGLGNWSLIFGKILPIGKHYFSAVLVPNTTNEQNAKKQTSNLEETDPISLTLAYNRPIQSDEIDRDIIARHFEDRIEIKHALIGGGYQYTNIYSVNALIQDKPVKKLSQ